VPLDASYGTSSRLIGYSKLADNMRIVFSIPQKIIASSRIMSYGDKT